MFRKRRQQACLRLAGCRIPKERVRMHFNRVAVWSCVMMLSAVAGLRGFAAAAKDDTNGFTAADAQILSEVREHSEAMQNLEYLSDNIGARLTGSAQLKQANDWTAQQMKKYGLVNVHLEPWTIAHSWTRGTATARIVAPAEHRLTIASAGWSPSTAGVVRGPVVYFDAKTKADFDRFHGKLQGAVAIYQEPSVLSPPKPEDVNEEYVRAMQAPPPMKGQPATPSPFAAFMEVARARNDFFKQEGVAAVLRDSNKPHGLLNMTGIGGEKFDIGAIPSAFITGEGYRMLWRMLKHGPVTIEIAMTNRLSDKPVEVYNTFGEIRRSEKPDEVVILGAHLDSWDLGPGSTDNGTGSMAVLEAARTLAKLNLKPKRTIRFVLFSGEEEGLVGSVKYVEAHRDELEKISGVLVHDTGTGRVLTLALHDNYQDREIVDQVLAPLKELRLLEPTMMHMSGTDHLSFNEAGVPGFWTLQDGAEYSKTHHSQSDTFDKVWKDDLNEGAQVLAAWAYNTAQLQEMLPRRPLPYRPSGDAAKAEASKPDPIVEMDTKILEQVKSDQAELKSNMKYLTERIGPRLTGSPQLDRASHWTLERFKEFGLSNAHLEPWTIANSWMRGPATGRILAPTEATLTMAAAGWSPSTNGTIRGAVLGLAYDKLEDLDKYRGKLQGEIILLGQAREMEAPGNPMTTPWGEETIPVAHAKGEAPYVSGEYRKIRMALTKMIFDEKPAAVLIGSEKEYGLLNMSTYSRDYQPAGAPVAFVAREDYRQLWRLLG